MKETPKMRKLYLEIQDKLFYMIPEGFTKIFLYTSIIDQVHGMPIGEMFFYYFPKGIFKKKAVNVYEIPNKFNIDEDVYSKLVNDLYNTIKMLREETIASGQRVWSNFTISIEDYKFSIEYHYDDLTQSPYSNYERHIIWRYKYLQTDLHTYSKKEQNLIKRYLEEKNEDRGEVYEESIYANKRKNIIGYETTSNNEEMILQEQPKDEDMNKVEEINNTKENIEEAKKEKIVETKKRKIKSKINAKRNEETTNNEEVEKKAEINQILNIQN